MELRRVELKARRWGTPVSGRPRQAFVIY